MAASNSVYYGQNGIRGEIVAGSGLEQWLNDGHVPPDLMEDVSYVKTGRHIKAGFADLKDIDGSTTQQVFIKEFRHKPGFRIIYGLLGRHRARNVWKISWALLDQSIPVPQPFGYFTHGVGRRIGVSYYCCEALRETDNLGVIARHREEFEAMVSTGFLENFARDLAIFHQCGAIHGDLKWSNILVDNNRERYWFTDLDAAHYRAGHCNNKSIACDLARFVVSGIEYGYSAQIRNEFLTFYATCFGHRFSEIHSLIEPRVNKLLQRKKIA